MVDRAVARLLFNKRLNTAMETLANLESFVKSAESGSFSEAGRRLGLTAAAVSRNIAMLERNLGVRLFQRSTRKLTLTEAGARFLQSIGGSIETLQGAIEEASSDASEPAGVLKVSLSTTFGIAHVLPLLPEFLQRYPRIRPEWHFESRRVDLVQEGYDLAIGGGFAFAPGTLKMLQAVCGYSPGGKVGKMRAPHHGQRNFFMETIGIIGAGAIGSAFAKALVHKGIKAVISNSRGPASLADLVGELGPTISAGTREEAAAQDIVLVAVPWSKLPAALSGLPDFAGRIVIDANNPIEAPEFKPFELNGRTSSEVFAEFVPGACVVKAINHLPVALVSIDTGVEGGRRVLFLAGDDVPAKAKVLSLIEQAGFFGIDLGSIKAGGPLFQIPGGQLAIQNLVKLG